MRLIEETEKKEQQFGNENCTDQKYKIRKQ